MLFSNTPDETFEAGQDLSMLLQMTTHIATCVKNIIAKDANRMRFNSEQRLGLSDTFINIHEGCLNKAKKTYALRRKRDKIFNDIDIFGEPAWDILLDLFIASETGTAISVTSACIASNVPATTALRWITELERNDLIKRDVDERDARRTFVSLTPKGIDLMLAYFL